MTDEGEDEDEVPAKKKKTPKKGSKENKKVSKKIEKKKGVTVKGNVKTAKKIGENEQVGCVRLSKRLWYRLVSRAM